MTQPNILFFQVDQLAAQYLRCYGDPVCHAPNIERLAAKGTVFDTAYCNFPLCSPSRASMLTGKLCSDIGAYDNAAELGATHPGYADYLRASGYQTALSGKMHFIGPDQHHGFERRLTPDLYPADFSWVPNWGDEGKRDTNDARSVTISGLCERSTQLDFDDLVTYQAVQHLYDIARGDDARPFFLQVSYTHPHEPYLCRREHWDLYEDGVPSPATGALRTSEHDAHSVRLLRDFGMLEAGFSEQDIQRARRAYYGSISYIDGLIGQVMEVLEATGQSDNTVIVFTSDHGDMLGERGMWFKKHFYEPSLRVPLIIAGGGFGARRALTPASLVDLLPTFMGIATGADWTSAVEPLEGADLASLCKTPQPDRVIYAEYLAEATTAPILMVRQGRYKYVYCDADPALLFDLVDDPAERRNLADDLAYADLRAQLHALVEARWDRGKLEADIRLSQQRRRLVLAAAKQGQRPRWNHDERPDEEVPWYRGQTSYNDWAFQYLPVRAAPPESSP